MLSQVVSGISLASEYVPETKIVKGALLAAGSCYLLCKSDLSMEVFNAMTDLFRDKPKPLMPLNSRNIVIGCIGYGLLFPSLYLLAS